MRWLDRCGDDASQVSAAWQLLVEGRNGASLRAAEHCLHTLSNPYALVTAHIGRLAALVNLGRTTQYASAVEAAFAAVAELSEPYPQGHLHALAALATRGQGSPERSLTHLVRAARALDAVTGEADVYLAWGWHDLGTAYSYLGFHAYALTALERARQHAATAGSTTELFAQPEVRLRMALALDHHGDSDGCLRVLRDLGGELARQDQARLRPAGRVGYGYALARRAVLGEAGPGTPSTGTPSAGTPAWPAAARALLAAGTEGQAARDLRVLGEVCLMIAAGKATDALSRLDTVTVEPDSLGPAEPARLRSLAFAAGGDHAGAHQADRHAFRLSSARTDRLRDLFLEGIAARIDHEDVRRTVSRHDHGTLTDPLTGLPSRRHLERYVAALVGRGEQAMVGTVDLDSLASVNEAHGRLAGDLVLQRVAAVVARILRRGDFVARYGGDEFVVVLAGATQRHASDVAGRISAAVAAEDWVTLVPGTRIGVTVTWTSVPG